MMKLLLVMALVSTSYASQCGTAHIPFSLEVLESGRTILGCSRPACFGWTTAGFPLPSNSQFIEVPGFQNVSDGFTRDEEITVASFNGATNPEQSAHCEEGFGSEQCSEDQWVGGIEPGSLRLKCCSSTRLQNSIDRGVASIGPGQIFIGGPVEDNGSKFFDVVTNLQRGEDGIYSTSVRRIQCEDLTESGEQVVPEDHGFQGPPNPNPPIQPPPQPGSIEGPVPGPPPPNFVPLPNFVVPSGFGAGFGGDGHFCFPSDALVKLSSKKYQRMDQLKVGDYILTTDEDGHEYSRLEYFLHRDPEEKVEFIRFHLSSGKNVSMTRQHNIFVEKCRRGDVNPMKMKKMKAEEVSVGKCLLTSGNKLVKITSIEKHTSRGYYAPFTSSSTMFVNDIFVSCTSENDYPSLQRFFFKAIQKFLQTTTIFGNTFYSDSLIPELLKLVTLITP